jgi:sugar phosphate isomerase/epimerase
VAPSRVWRDTWRGLGAAEVTAYRKAVEGAGLRVVGLHSLLYDQPGLDLFGAKDQRRQTMEFMEHLSRICRDLGGRTLIWGAGRKRGSLPLDDATRAAAGFFRELCPRIADHGTCFCFEPLSADDADFINSALDALQIVLAVDHPALQVQLDAKALVANGEAELATFRAVAPHLVHFHANEPDLGVLGTSGSVDHGLLGRFLNQVGYGGCVSIEQRMGNGADPIADVASSAAVLMEHYR